MKRAKVRNRHTLKEPKMTGEGVERADNHNPFVFSRENSISLKTKSDSKT